MDNTSYIPPTNPLGEEEKSTAQLGDIIGKLTSDPELMGKIFSVLGKDTPVEQKKEDLNPSPAVTVQAPPPASNDIASKLPEIMATIAPMLSGGTPKALDGALKGFDKKDDRRTCLLRAIKPYVNRGRGEAIDYMIRIAGITEILKHLN